VLPARVASPVTPGEDLHPEQPETAVSYASVRARRRATRVAALLAAVFALGGALVPAPPAAAVSGAGASGCTVSDADLVWGFKESFRAYIDGAIANGEWTTTGEVSYDTPLFTWSGGAGGTEPDDALVVEFSGAVRFTGHGGVLDTTIENPRLVIRGDRAVLQLDVHGTTQAGDAVDEAGVEFAELDLAAAERTQEGAVLTLAGIPAVLTAAGSSAFGTYAPDEVLDPITLTANLDGDCRVFEQGWPTWAIAAIVGAGVIGAVVVVVVIVMVRRRSLSA
jgi:hypothetical protein